MIKIKEETNKIGNNKTRKKMKQMINKVGKPLSILIKKMTQIISIRNEMRYHYRHYKHKKNNK